jgi:hypothetical protein
LALIAPSSDFLDRYCQEKSGDATLTRHFVTSKAKRFSLAGSVFPAARLFVLFVGVDGWLGDQTRLSMVADQNKVSTPYLSVVARHIHHKALYAVKISRRGSPKGGVHASDLAGCGAVRSRLDTCLATKRK